MKAKNGIFLAIIFAGGLTVGATPYATAQCGFCFFKHEKRTSRAWLGVYLQDVSPELAKEKGLKAEEGAYVNRVERRSPADFAGIRAGDVIVEFDGKKIDDAEDLVRVVRKADVGTKAGVTFLRNGKKKELEVMLKKYPRRWSFRAFIPPKMPPRVMIFKGRETIGLSLIQLHSQLGKYFGAPDGKGVLVESVKEESKAEKAGFKAGDVILKVGDMKVEKIRDIRHQLSEYEEGEKVNMEILRKGSRMTLTLEAAEVDESMDFELMLGEFFPHEWLEDFDIEIFEPDDEEILEFQLPDFKPELDRLRLELEGLKERFFDSRNDLGRRIRHQLDRSRLRAET